jgi:RNA polymerase sigma-70 factor (ECF subfamily)
MTPAPNSAAALETRLAGLQHTDGEAFMEALYRAYYRQLATTAVRIVQDRAAAEDLVQEVLLTVWKNRDALVITSTYQAYLTRAVLNAALRYAARHQRQVAWDEMSPPDAGRNTTEEHLYGQEAEAAVAAALAALPPQCRAVFLLADKTG